MIIFDLAVSRFGNSFMAYDDSLVGLLLARNVIAFDICVS